MTISAWHPQLLVAFLEGVWSARSESAAALTAVERAAETFDAEVAAIMCREHLVAAVGYPEGATPVAELSRLRSDGTRHHLDEPGAGRCEAACVSLDYPAGGAFILARSGPGGLHREETILLRGMARVASMAMRTQSLLDAERAAREESDHQAAENARLLAELTHRQGRLTELADEQAALRRVATLVAGQAPPDRIFAAVAEEVGRLLRAETGGVTMFDADGRMIVMAAWTRSGAEIPIPLSTPFAIEDDSLTALVLRSGRPARLDRYDGVSTPVERMRSQLGLTSAAGAPIVVGGRVWGVMSVGSSHPAGLPAGSEQRVADFTELVAMAISNAEARGELAQLADEQAALRQVATLVATGVATSVLFDAVTTEMRLLLSATAASLLRFERDGTATVLAADSDPDLAIPVRTRLALDGKSVAVAVYRTGRPARIDGFEGPPGSIAAAYRDLGMHAAAGAPIIVEGRLWGAIIADWRQPQAVPADTEGRIAQFTQLVATAISNAASRAQLAASRARIVATADETRRRLERDLHDGIQQRLVSLALELRNIRGDVPPGHEGLVQQLAHAGGGLVAVLDELREISRGVHPAILSQGGLAPALRGLARRSGVPVELSLARVGRLPEHVEVAAYYAASEALANAAKHARASVARVELQVDETALHLSIRDDGAGGADPARGSGIIGLIDRVDALGGTMSITSPPGEGTTLAITLPLEPDRPA